MLKAGDHLRWRGLNRCYTGVVVESENGELLVEVDTGGQFKAKDFRETECELINE